MKSTTSSGKKSKASSRKTFLKRMQTATIKIAGQPDHQSAFRSTTITSTSTIRRRHAGPRDRDLTSGNYRVFSFAPRLSAILLESEDADVEIVKNPDGSYTVGDEHAENGREAVKLLQNDAVFGDASSHGLLLAYAMAQKATPWTSLMKSAVGPQPSPAAALTRAEVGAVCERFQDFCDCAACFKIGQVDSCKRCPQ